MKKEIKTYEKIMLGIYIKVYQKDCILIHLYLTKNLLVWWDFLRNSEIKMC